MMMLAPASSPTGVIDVSRIRRSVEALTGKDLILLAERAGIGRSTLYAFRAQPDRRSVRLSTLVRLRDALDAPNGESAG